MMKKKTYSAPTLTVCNVIAECLMEEPSTVVTLSRVQGTIKEPEDGGMLTGGNETDDDLFYVN